MILNLNPLTFYPFGTLQTSLSDADHLDHYEYESIELFNNTLFHLEKSDHDTFIQVEEGVTLLYVSLTPYQKDVKVFLLDKALSLHKDTYFGIIPFTNGCKIRCGHHKDHLPHYFNLVKPLSPHTVTPNFDLKDIYTLFYQEKEKSFTFKGESHPFWELTYVDRGTLKTIVDGQTYTLQQGECLFYSPQQFHSQESLNDENLCFMTLTFDMSIEHNRHLSNRIFHSTRKVKDLLENILKEQQHPNLYTEDLILCYLKEIIIELVRNQRMGSGDRLLETDVQNNAENNIVVKAKDYIHQHIDKKLTIGSIARTIPISSSYLSKIFKKHTDMTIVDYMNEYRLKKSKELIRHSCYNFTEIATILGFNSVHYFSKQFKKRYGITPTMYSKSLHFNEKK